MPETESTRVIVGIDGSEQAEHAAGWAVDEALRRRAVLHLIYVIRTDLTGMLTAPEYENAVSTAKRALKAARGRIAERGGDVQTTTAIEQGYPAGVLLAESGSTDMICVGWTGMNRIGITLMGSTATSVATKATCPVAIVRRPIRAPATEPQSKWIIAPVDADSRDNDTMLAEAASEARQRGWAILAVWTNSGSDKTCADAVSRLASEWRLQAPDVHIYPVATGDDLARFLHASPDLGGLIMIDGDRAKDVAATIDRIGHACTAEIAVVVTHRVAGRTPTSAVTRC